MNSSPDRLVGFVPAQQPQAGEEAAGIGIDHEGGAAAGVEENGVGGLRADPLQGEQIATDRVQVAGEHGSKIAAEAGEEMGGEELQAFGFLAEEPGGADQLLQFGSRQTEQRLRGEGAGRPQMGNGPLHVAPVGVLGEYRPDHHLERRLRRPPVQRAVMGGETVENSRKDVFSIACLSSAP